MAKLDFFRRVPEDLKVPTSSGSFFSLVSFTAMGFLLLSHWSAYTEPRTKTTVVLDEHQEDRLRVNFNVSLFNVPCAVASVDLEDFMGQQFTNLTRHIRHFRLATDSETMQVHRMDEVVIDNHEKGIPVWGGVHRETAPDGNVHYSTPLTSKTFDDFMAKYELVLVNFYAPWCVFSHQLHPEWERAAAQLPDHPEYSEMVRMASVDCTDPDAIWLCRRAHIRAFPSMLIYIYGSTSTRYVYNGPRRTEHLLQFLDLFFRRLEPDADFAEEVNVNNDQLGLPLPVRVNEGNLEAIDFTKRRPSNAVQTFEGCEIVGSISVNRVPGVLAFTVRSDDMTLDARTIDVSHVVNHFSFGQVRRTENLFVGGNNVLAAPSNRYPLDKKFFAVERVNVSVEHFLNVVGFDSQANSGATHLQQRSYEFLATSTQSVGKQPSALFRFDISPLVIQVTADDTPFYHFITHLCAVIGGVFTILGLVDSGVFHAMNSIKKKQQIGKLS
uniref:Thioredoxin domain-containing protein n=2 Tax=Hyaloperonospora arabidopsidis (strain Emoy2) TaxID=559515 RepID=M4BE25_HYAAE